MLFHLYLNVSPCVYGGPNNVFKVNAAKSNNWPSSMLKRQYSKYSYPPVE